MIAGEFKVREFISNYRQWGYLFEETNLFRTGRKYSPDHNISNCEWAWL